MTTSSRILHAATGSNLTAKGWAQEAAIRMLHNNLDPAVAEHPENLVVYGGTGKAARNWPSFDAIVKSLTNLKDDETLLVQSGKPVGVFQTHEWAPRVLIANSNLVGDWANWPEFRRLEQLGLTMYGQMTAGSWIYIGTQGILQGTYETFAAVAQKRFNGTLQGTLTLTGGCGGMGGAQPLAVTMNGGVCLVIDIDKTRLEKRIETRYLDEIADNVDDAVERVLKAKAAKVPLSVGLEGNAAELFPLLLSMDVPIDIVTDQTSAHDPFSYVPVGVSVHEAAQMAKDNPADFTKRSQASMAKHVEAMVGFMDKGAEVFDYGNSIRDEARQGGFSRAFAFPGFVPAYIRPLFCEGKGPFRWVALSGDPKDIYRTDKAVLDLFPENEGLHRWITMAQEKVAFQGLPARICWLGYGERDKAGLAFNDLVARGEVSAPIVIGRDHLDCGSVASPYRETEAMLDGSDAMNADPDYSAGYLRIDTDQAGLSGHSLVFTIGRGNDVQIAAIKMLVQRFAGMDIDEAYKNIGKITRELSSDSQIRWLGPDTGVFHMGIGAVLNALWDLFAKSRNVPLWKLLSDMSPEEIVAAIDFRYISDAITPAEALAILNGDKQPKLVKFGYSDDEAFAVGLTCGGIIHLFIQPLEW